MIESLITTPMFMDCDVILMHEEKIVACITYEYGALKDIESEHEYQWGYDKDEFLSDCACEIYGAYKIFSMSH
jgi:hypothetical protein